MRPFAAGLTTWVDGTGEVPIRTSIAALQEIFSEHAERSGWSDAAITRAIGWATKADPLDMAYELQVAAARPHDYTDIDEEMPARLHDISEHAAATEVEPVGLLEIAQRLGAQAQTARNWRTRGVLPSASWLVSGSPAWDWAAIEAWAQETGRLPDIS